MGEVLVNGPQTPLATSLKPANVNPPVPEFPPGKYQFKYFLVLILIITELMHTSLNYNWVNNNFGVACTCIFTMHLDSSVKFNT